MSGSRVGKGLLVVATAIVLGVIGTGLYVLDSPAAQRAQRLDERRTRDLAEIGEHIDRWYDQHDRLPPDLATLAALPGVRLAIADPDSVAYEFVATGSGHYRLCASFATDSRETTGHRASPDAWPHPRGRHCFDRAVARKRDD